MPRATDKIEIRQRGAAESDLSLRATTGDPTFFGHAAVVNTRTSIGNPLTWGFFEEVDARAFDRTLTEADPRFLVDHDTAKIVSRVSSGDLRLSVDGTGLVVDSDLDQEVSYVKDMARNVDKRRITGMSFGFVVTKDAWSTVDIESVDDKGKTFTTQADLRRILDLDLWEVSAVTFPVYEETDAALRAIQLSPWVMSKRRDMIASTKRVGRDRIGRALDLLTELRAGKTLSAANIAVLQGILDNVAAADMAFDPMVMCVTAVDDALDQAQTDLANLIGVPDPDANDPDEGDDPAKVSTGMGRSASGLFVPTAEYMRSLGMRSGQRS